MLAAFFSQEFAQAGTTLTQFKKPKRSEIIQMSLFLFSFFCVEQDFLHT